MFILSIVVLFVSLKGWTSSIRPLIQFHILPWLEFCCHQPLEFYCISIDSNIIWYLITISLKKQCNTAKLWETSHTIRRQKLSEIFNPEWVQWQISGIDYFEEGSSDQSYFWACRPWPDKGLDKIFRPDKLVQFPKPKLHFKSWSLPISKLENRTYIFLTIIML